MIIVFTLSVVNRGFESLSGQTNYYKIGICYFSTKHAEQREVSLNIFDQLINIVQYDKFQYDTIQIIKGIRKQV